MRAATISFPELQEQLTEHGSHMPGFLNYGYINIIYLAISLIILPLFSENRHDGESTIRNKISTGGTYTVVCV